MIALAAFVMVSQAFGQTDFSEIQGVIASRKSSASFKKYEVAGLKSNIPDRTQWDFLISELDTSNCPDAEYDAVVATRDYIFVSMGFEMFAVAMADQWGMDSNDPMLNWMVGPFVRESMWQQMERYYGKGCDLLEQAATQDQQNAVNLESYNYWLEMEDLYGGDPMYAMMYYWMLSYYEGQLSSGYNASANKYLLAKFRFDDSSSTCVSIWNTWVNVKSVRDMYVQ